MYRKQLDYYAKGRSSLKPSKYLPLKTDPGGRLASRVVACLRRILTRAIGPCFYGMVESA